MGFLRSIFFALGLTAVGMVGCEESSKPPIVQCDAGIEARVDAGNNGRRDAAPPMNDAGYRHDVYDAGSDATKPNDADYHSDIPDARPDTTPEEGHDAEISPDGFQNPDIGLPPECVDGRNEYQPCGENNEGKSYRFCREGRWTEYTPCDVPHECENLGQRVLFYTGPLETRNVGECKEGIKECIERNGKQVYDIVQPETVPAQDLCNRKDDDCDDQTDEGCGCAVPDIRACGDPIVGECREGVQMCDFDGIWSECFGYRGPEPERCDGRDNNCDTQTDEGYALGADCLVGVGACERSGVTVCAPNGDGTVCSARPRQPQAEKCDGSDADCDGVPNNGYDVGAACEVGLGACKAEGTKVCDLNLDARVTRCDAPIIEPQPEVCGNEVDEDCDGEVDNDRRADCTVCDEPGLTVCDDGIEYCSIQFAVRNAGFEKHPVGNEVIPCWESSESPPRLVDAEDHHGPICEEEYVVRKLEGDRNSYTLTQRIVVADRAERIDSNQQRVELSAQVVSANDYARFGFRFYDGEGVLLGEQFDEFRNREEGCQNRSYQTQMPERTRQVDIVLTGENREGNTNNTTFDDVRINFPE